MNKRKRRKKKNNFRRHLLLLKNEVGGTCSKYGGEERGVQGLGGETGGKETIGETQA
jgi:hypothetical protein